MTTPNLTPAPLSPEREAEIRAWRDELARTANSSMKFSELAILTDLLDELDRGRAELERLEEQNKASLRRADQLNNALMAEVQRYAEGTEHPVLWSVYNRMHCRALTAEAALTRLDQMATAWLERLPEAIRTATAAEAVHDVVRTAKGAVR